MLTESQFKPVSTPLILDCIDKSIQTIVDGQPERAAHLLALLREWIESDIAEIESLTAVKQ